MLILLVLANLSRVGGQVHLVKRLLVRFHCRLITVGGRLTETSQTLRITLTIALMSTVDLSK